MQNKIILTSLCMALVTGACEARIAIVQDSGEKVELSEDGTWKPAAEQANQEQPQTAAPLVANPKTPDEAVSIYDTQLNRREHNYSNAVTFKINYKNKSAKKIIGIYANASFNNAFGKTVYTQNFEDEVVIEPGQMTNVDSFWTFKDNPYIANEPYDHMWQGVDNNTIKVKAKILKVVFEDGTVVEAAKAKKPTAKKR